MNETLVAVASARELRAHIRFSRGSARLAFPSVRRPLSRPLSFRQAASCPRSTLSLAHARPHRADPTRANRIFPRACPGLEVYPPLSASLTLSDHSFTLSVVTRSSDRLCTCNGTRQPAPLNRFHRRCTLELLRPTLHRQPPLRKLVHFHCPVEGVTFRNSRRGLNSSVHASRVPFSSSGWCTSTELYRGEDSFGSETVRAFYGSFFVSVIIPSLLNGLLRRGTLYDCSER